MHFNVTPPSSHLSPRLASPNHLNSLSPWLAETSRMGLLLQPGLGNQWEWHLVFKAFVPSIHISVPDQGSLQAWKPRGSQTWPWASNQRAPSPSHLSHDGSMAVNGRSRLEQLQADNHFPLHRITFSDAAVLSDRFSLRSSFLGVHNVPGTPRKGGNTCGCLPSQGDQAGKYSWAG